MTSLLSWNGDNIGFSAEAPATIDLMSPDREGISASVSEALAMLDRISVYGRARILGALRHCAATGELHPSDVDAYRAWEARHG